MQIFPSGNRPTRKANRLSLFPCLLFLDMDGVLNGEKASGTIDQQMVANLHRILQATGAGIVLSTGWRFDQDKVWMLARSVPEFNERFVGEIPDLGAEESYWSGNQEVNRWDEIEAWLEENGYTGPYAVLDDRDDMLREQPSFFHTVTSTDGGKPKRGLTKEISQRVIDYLKPKEQAETVE